MKKTIKKRSLLERYKIIGSKEHIILLKEYTKEYISLLEKRIEQLNKELENRTNIDDKFYISMKIKEIDFDLYLFKNLFYGVKNDK